MQSRRYVRSLKSAALILFFSALAGCAAFKPVSPEETVRQRADTYWKARIAGQADKAYALSTPSYRKVRTEDQFKSQFGAAVSLQLANVYSVICVPEKCTVRMQLGVRPALAGMSNLGVISTYVDETWLLEDRQWWRYQDL